MAKTAQVRRSRRPAADRRGDLLMAAREAFLVNGVSGAGMRQIAAMADVDPAVLYRHFPSKQALFEAAVLEPMRALVDDLIADGRVILESPVEEKAEHLVHGMTRLAGAMTEIAPLMAVAFYSDPELGREVYREHFGPLLERVAEAVTTNLATWAQRPVDARLAVLSAFSMCFGAAMDARYLDRPLDAETTGAELARLLLSGVLGE